MKIRPIILCGGEGTRLWQNTKNNQAKQFIDFGDETLIEKTLKRIKGPIFDYPILSTNLRHLSTIKKYLKKLQIKRYKIILEPVKKNTAPAILVNKDLIKNSDLLIMNETELSTLSGDKIFSDSSPKEIENSLKKILSNKKKSAIVTLGSKGAYIFEEQKGTYIPGLEVVAVDTTGSGDCFVGALASHYSQHHHLVDAACFANQAAALSVTRKGASASMPYLNEVVNLR